MKKAVILAAVLGLALSTGALACPQDKFQRQSGNFQWLVSGQFHGNQFAQRGNSVKSLRVLLRRILRKHKGRRRGGDT